MQSCRYRQEGYCFWPDFCHAYDPQSKGIVKNLITYALHDLMVSLGAVGQRIIDLTTANTAAAV